MPPIQSETLMAALLGAKTSRLVFKEHRLSCYCSCTVQYQEFQNGVASNLRFSLSSYHYSSYSNYCDSLCYGLPAVWQLAVQASHPSNFFGIRINSINRLFFGLSMQATKL